MTRLQLGPFDDGRLLHIEEFDAPRFQDKASLITSELRMKDLQKNLSARLHMHASHDHEQQQPPKREVGNEPLQPGDSLRLDGAKSNLADGDEEALQSEAIQSESKRSRNSLSLRKGVSVRSSKGRIPSRKSRSGPTSQDASNELKLEKDTAETHFPTFVVEMKRSNVIVGFWLNIPAEFSCKHLPNKDEPIVLQDSQGLKWETKYLARKNSLSAGWSRFAMDHRLELGDALVFELVKPLEFLVHITGISNCKRDAAVTIASTTAPNSRSRSMHSSPRKRMKIVDTQDKVSVPKQVTTRSSQKLASGDTGQ